MIKYQVSPQFIYDKYQSTFLLSGDQSLTNNLHNITSEFMRDI